MLIASQLDRSGFRSEFKLLSGKRGSRCSCVFAAFAESVSTCIVSELLSSASMRRRIETIRRHLRSIYACGCKRTIGEDGSAAKLRGDVRAVL